MAIIRLRFKILFDPVDGGGIPIGLMLENVKRIFSKPQIGLDVKLEGTPQNLFLPDLEHLEVMPGCPLDKLSEKQAALYKYRDDVQAGEIVIYFVKTISSGLKACAAHSAGQPSAVLSAKATEWTLAHEIGHILGLKHADSALRLMFNNTGKFSEDLPLLTEEEIIQAKVRLREIALGV
jgi:hypothetical protein